MSSSWPIERRAETERLAVDDRQVRERMSRVCVAASPCLPWRSLDRLRGNYSVMGYWGGGGAFRPDTFSDGTVLGGAAVSISSFRVNQSPLTGPAQSALFIHIRPV